MPPFNCCLIFWRRRTQDNAGARSIEQPSTSNPAVLNEEQPSTSDPAVQNAEQPSTSNAGVQNAEQPSTSIPGVQNVEQTSTSNPGAQNVEQPTTSNSEVQTIDQPSTSNSSGFFASYLRYDETFRGSFRLPNSTSNAGVQNIDQLSTSNAGVQNAEPSTSNSEIQNAEQPSTSNSGVQNVDQLSTSNSEIQTIDQPSTSNASGFFTLGSVRYDFRVQNIDQPSTSNSEIQTIDQPSTSNASDVIGGNLAFEEAFRTFRLADSTFCRIIIEEGKVIYGTLRNQNIAIRSLHSQGLDSEEFDAIVSSLRRARHPNLTKVIGHIIRQQFRLVVYKCSKLDSLDLHLFDHEKEPLDCNTRMKIAVGSAKGLEYLHKTMNPPVVHRNLTTENVFLDEGFVPKLFDFGVPKKHPQWWNRSKPFGIKGWTAPECVQSCVFTLENDVYSFGILLLVILTGRKAYDDKIPNEAERGIVFWVWDQVKRASAVDEEKGLEDIVDPRMKQKYPKEILFSYLKLAASCTASNPSSRPDMSNVCRQLLLIASLL